MSGHDLRPIETSYAGCRFRSRLEARWAVFFDTLGIRWEYEAQGFKCQPRCGLSGTKSFWYLPDFWLPELKLHAEVKGSLTEQETRRLLDAAAYLSAPRGGCGDGSDMIVLGQIPRPEKTGVPVLLHMHKGVLLGYPWTGRGRTPGCAYYSWVFTTDGDESIDLENYAPGDLLRAWYENWPQVTQLLLDGARGCYPGPGFQRGCQAARSARFEHGQSGAPERWS